MLVQFILVQMSYPGKKAPLCCCNCVCSETFCGLEMLKSQILPYQQKLLLAVGLLQTYPGQAATLEESHALDD